MKKARKVIHKKEKGDPISREKNKGKSAKEIIHDKDRAKKGRAGGGKIKYQAQQRRSKGEEGGHIVRRPVPQRRNVNTNKTG